MGRLSSRDRPEQQALQLGASEAVHEFRIDDFRAGDFVDPAVDALRAVRILSVGDETMGDFIRRLRVRMTATSVPANPYFGDDDWAASARHFSCTFVRWDQGRARRFRTFFSMGAGLRGGPTAEDVLDSLRSDAQSVEDRGLEGWTEFTNGHETQARRAYRHIINQSRRLRAFLGEANYRSLLEEVIMG